MTFTISEALSKEEGGCNCCQYGRDLEVPKRVFKVHIRFNEHQGASWRFCKTHLVELKEAIEDALDPLPPRWSKKLTVKRRPSPVGWEKIMQDNQKNKEKS